MKKVLIITYYWPPSGGAGVQRWLKFIKYLRLYGWEPVVYTPENPEAPSVDNSLMKDVPANLTVIKTKIREPYTAYKTFIGKKDQAINAGFLSETKKPKRSESIAVWIRGNLFIPDARKFWIKPSIKYLVQYLSKNPVDAIISSGPPHSMHMIALGVKKKLSIPWLADFRDPWTNIDFYDQLKLSKRADRLHRKKEKDVISAADKIVTVNRTMAEEFEAMGARETAVVSNGFDEEDFNLENRTLSREFSIIHLGSINKDRNSETFWVALKELLNELEGLRNDLKIVLIGKNDISVVESIERNELSYCTQYIKYLPHDDAIEEAAKAQILLLPLNNTPNALGITTGKVFEYLALKRPIMCIGPTNGDCARILNDTSSGSVAGFDDKEKMKSIMKAYYELYKKNALKLESKDLQKFSRKNLAGEIAGLLETIISGRNKNVNQFRKFT